MTPLAMSTLQLKQTSRTARFFCVSISTEGDLALSDGVPSFLRLFGRAPCLLSALTRFAADAGTVELIEGPPELWGIAWSDFADASSS